MILGTCQLNICQDKAELKSWLDRIATYSNPGFWLFPELCLGGFEYLHKKKWLNQLADILDLIADFSCSTGHGAGIGLWTQKFNKFYNSFYLMLPHWSRPINIYNKMHLFPLSKEEQVFSPGYQLPKPFTWGNITFGFGICFDLRFPELFRYQNNDNVNVFLIPAQWPLKRLIHWQTLLSARAIENQTYFLACNGCGNSVLGELAGHSGLINPWGENIFCLGTSPGIDCAQIDLQLVQKTKSLFQTQHSNFFKIQTVFEQKDNIS